jgi:hypothetical protein
MCVLIVTALFGLIMAANTVALVRQWRMMAAMNGTLISLIEAQRLFDAAMRDQLGDYISSADASP